MRLLVFLFLLIGWSLNGQTKTIHIFVALCDNENQGIVKVPAHLGNGQQPENNLYWGAAYGIKTFFQNKTSDWQLIRQLPVANDTILERLLFKHVTKDIFLLADAYDGAHIRTCVEDFLLSANGQHPRYHLQNQELLEFGGKADLLAYVGHDGLMDFQVDLSYTSISEPSRDVMILACFSKSFFAPEIEKAQTTPLLWTTHLMAPESYTLKAAIDGWIAGESGKQIDERAAQAYHQYQQCGIRGARNLFTSGF